MFKVYSAAVLLFLLAPINHTFAQTEEGWSSKTFSGNLTQNDQKEHGSLWHRLFGKKSIDPKLQVPASQCSVEFKSPITFTHHWVSQVPENIGYVVNFRGPQPALKKFVIKIYTVDGEDYILDPDAEGKQIGVKDEHHVYDQYLIYLILGTDISRLEVDGTSDVGHEKYVLDKIEVLNDD